MKEFLDILILEDNSSDVDLAKYELNKLKQPFALHLAKNKKEYLELFKEGLPDIVLSDFNLPDMDGEEALEILRAKDKDIPFILISATIGEEKAVQLMRNGANDYIMKDKLKKLAPTIEREIEAYEILKQSELEHNEVILYSRIFTNSNDSICILDENGFILKGNLATEKLMGLSVEYVVGKSPGEFFGEKNFEIIFSLAKKNGSITRNVRFKNSFGDIKTIDLTIIEITDSDENKKYACIKHDITEKVNTQKILYEQKRQLDTLVSNLPGMAYRCLVDDDWTMLYVSNGVKELTGYEPSELLNNKDLSYNDIIDPDEAEKDWDPIYKAIEEGKHYEIEYKIIAKDGKTKWVWEKAFPVGKDENGYIITEGFITDITERKMIEESLETSYNIIIRSPSVAFKWKNDKTWTVDFVTDNVENIFGYTKEEFYNKKILYADIIFKEDLGNIIKEMSEYSSKIEVSSVTHKSYRIVTKNNEIKWVKDDTYVLKDNDNNIIAYEGIITDVTDMVEAQKDLLILSTAVDQSPSIIVLTNISGDIVYTNPVFTEITGYTVEEIKGKNPRILKSGGMDDELYGELWTTVSSGKVWSGEMSNKKKDGTIYWEKAIVSPVFNKEKEIINYLKIGEDITEQKRMESELEDHRDHLEELVKSRTIELNRKFDEVEKLNRLFLNREHRINELRDELKKIKKRFKLD